MAKVVAPLLAFEAKGQIAKTHVYANWRGVPYARRYVIPANPKTAAQKQTRGVFLWLNYSWKIMAADVQAVWTAATKGQPLMNRNDWIKSNLTNLRGLTGAATTDLLKLVVSPGVNAGIAFATMVLADNAAHALTNTGTAPALPTGWAITKYHAITWAKQSAATDTKYASEYGSVAAPGPYAVTLATGAGTYDSMGFFEMTKPDGTTAFSPSLAAEQIIA